jgi:hypothetical protein
MKTQRLAILILVLMLSACSSTKQAPAPTETLPPTTEPTSTNLPATAVPTSEPTTTPTFTPTTEPLLNDGAPHTILKFKFPFEPGFPGYVVDIKSTVLTANLMCSLEQGKTTGEILDLNQSANDTNTLGICDTSSMTLNVLIPDQITVTVILGGFPVVNEITKKPDTVSEQQVEYYFEYSFK